MSKQIKKFEALPPAITKAMEASGEEFTVGDTFFKGDNVIRVSELKQHEGYDKDGKKRKVWYVHYESARDWEATQWSDYGSESLDDFLNNMKKGSYTKLGRPLSQVMEEANKVISGEISVDVYYQSEHEEVSEESAIVGRSSKAGLVAIQKDLEAKKRNAELIHKAVRYEMEKRKAKLEAVRRNLYGAVEKFMKQVKRIVRVIKSIELYLGVDEELVQIQEGEKADSKEPICFRQMVLFMDEEVGVYEDGGLDFTDIDKFDEWLLTGKNIDIVLPEKKGVVVLRPRRTSKEYNDPYLDAAMNEQNKIRTYILIRNGENIYRIYTEKLVILDRLFPRRKELAELMERMKKESWESNKEKMEDEMNSFKNRALLMQGLIDRTDVFHPLPVERINIFKLEDGEAHVRFIYDDEATLPSGRKPFNDWWKEIDERIQAGSRILITGHYKSENSWRRDTYSNPWAERFYLASSSPDGLKNVPDLPKEGIYEVEEFTSSSTHDFTETDYKKRIAELKAEGRKFKEEGILKGKQWRHGDKVTGSKTIYRLRYYDKPELTIMYMPKSEASNGWRSWDTHERKLRTRFKIFKDDSFLINYDQISLDDVEFYLHSRVDRRNYLKMMPILKKLRKFLIEEAKQEQHFLRFIADRNEAKLPTLKRKEIEQRVQEAINWWKFKNKWKRAITKDDALAMRMIEQRINSKNYKQLSKH